MTFKCVDRLCDALNNLSVSVQTNTMGLLTMSQASDRLSASIDAYTAAATARINAQAAQLTDLTARVTALENAPAPTGTDDATLNALSDRVDALTAQITPPAADPAQAPAS